MGKYKRYEKYKDSGIEWIGEVPEGWEVNRLKYLAKIRPSNVDKKINEEEVSVLLCNYVDVYKNDFITETLEYMKATATKEEIEKFRLYKYDVIVTKDSETPNDIGVPAMVNIDNNFELVCGYHLTFIRTKENKLSGSYLFRLLQSNRIRHYLSSNANGVTRFGLTTSVFADIVATIPPIKEQQYIANFLNRKTAEIDSLIADKEKLIELLQEKRQAIISETVTKGLDPNVKMKDSGIEWIGEVPEHWEITKIKRSFINLDYKRIPLSSEERGKMQDKIYPYYGASGVIDYVDNYIFNDTHILIGEDGANLFSRHTPLAFLATGKYWVNNHAHILKPKIGDIKYLVSLLECIDYTPYITGSAQPKLTADNLGSIDIYLPPSSEQKQIAFFVELKCGKIDSLITNIQTSIQKLKEYRQSLISESVTGKIDVREE